MFSDLTKNLPFDCMFMVNWWAGWFIEDVEIGRSCLAADDPEVKAGGFQELGSDLAKTSTFTVGSSNRQGQFASGLSGGVLILSRGRD